MEKQYFVWDDTYEDITLSRPVKSVRNRLTDKRKKSDVAESKIYCPHERLTLTFRETLSFPEQSEFRKEYQRKPNPRKKGEDVVVLQDVKDLVLYLLDSPVGIEFIGFAHLPIVDRFLRALILYMQYYLITWSELGEKRAATAKRASNPLAGGARVVRAEELHALRCLLGREYANLLTGSYRERRRYHHILSTGQHSDAEKDLRIFEALVQFAYRVVWIALERKHKELLELEMHRLFKTEAFNTAKRKFKETSDTDWEVPKDEHWILYGPEGPRKKKILQNSALPYELLNTDCDYRILSVGLTNVKSQDHRITYLENAIAAKEEDLTPLGIKLGILGLLRSDFDVLLIPLDSKDDKFMIDDTPDDNIEGGDDYKTLIPPSGSDHELNYFCLTNKVSQKEDDKILTNSIKKWILREIRRGTSKNK